MAVATCALGQAKPGAAPAKRSAPGVPSSESSLRIGSEIVDDSTRSRYGPRTTRWMSQTDFFRNSYRFQPLDTGIINYHRWNYVSRFNYFLTDLGHNGTALRPVFAGLDGPETIGVSSGFTAYDPYYQTEEPRLFDTQSPYTRIYLVWGGQGRAATRVEFSRNIKPNWNFGFNFRPILTDVQFQRRRGVRQTQSHYWDLYTAYQSNNDRYWMTMNYRRMRHRVEETGGVRIIRAPTADSTFASLFNLNNIARLTGTTSFDQRNELNFFHRYKIAPQLQLYHRAKNSRQINWFRTDVTPGNQNVSFFDTITYDVPERERNRALDSVRLSTFDNEVGLKGNVGNLFYYGYVRNRTFEHFNRFVLDRTPLPLSGREVFVGGGLRWDIDSVYFIKASAEQLEVQYHRLDASGALPFLNFTLHRSVSKPSFLVSSHRGRFDNWSNEFEAPDLTRATGHLNLRLGPLLLEPGATFVGLDNFIFFKRDDFPGKRQEVLPVQANGPVRYWLPEWRSQLTLFRRLHLRTQIIQTRMLANADSALQIPGWFVNAQIAYEGYWFNKALQVHAGVEGHWKSAYFAHGYDPVTQQFFVQTETLAPAFPIVDVFINAKIKQGRFFLRYHNLMQMFAGYGYLASAVYPGFRNVLDFGFELLLFD